MKVLFIHTFYKLSGGEDTVVKNEMELLKSIGHEVELLAFNNDNLSLLKLLLLPFNVFSYFKTKRFIKRFKPDLVHIHNTHFGGSLSTIHASSSLKIPVLMTLHNYRLLCPSGSLYFDGKIFMDSLQPGFPWTAVKKGVYKNSRLLTFWLAFSNALHHGLNTFSKVDSFIVLGAHSEELFTRNRFRKYAEKFVVKPNFSQPGIVTENNKSQYFLFIGRLTEEKGIKTLLNSFSKTTDEVIIVGSGPLVDQVLSVCNAKPNIKFLGQQEKAQLDGILDHAKALIFPSEWYETFGMVIIEAFSKGVPVIASNLGNIKCIVEHAKNGLTFEAGNPDDLLEKVNYYSSLSDDLKSDYQKQAITSYQEKYTPEISLEETLKIYLRALNRHSYPL